MHDYYSLMCTHTHTQQRGGYLTLLKCVLSDIYLVEKLYSAKYIVISQPMEKPKEISHQKMIASHI